MNDKEDESIHDKRDEEKNRIILENIQQMRGIFMYKYKLVGNYKHIWSVR